MDYHQLKLDRVDKKTVFNLFHDAIVPRPVTLIATISPDGRTTNVAPFSYINAAATDPPMLAFSILRKENGGTKDTLNNILATGEFSVCAVDRALLERANACGAALPAEQSEFEAFGLRPEAGVLIRAPRVADAPIQMECKLARTIEIGDGRAGSATLVLGEVLLVHVRKDRYLGDGLLDVEALALAGRCSIDRYLIADRFFKLDRPDTADLGARPS
jgi:flavin reductase (DIM6/NTAB) family NADH-FMN oxidoreductase RutF